MIMMFAKGQLEKKGLQCDVFDCFSTIIQTSSFLQSYRLTVCTWVFSLEMVSQISLLAEPCKW